MWNEPHSTRSIMTKWDGQVPFDADGNLICSIGFCPVACWKLNHGWLGELRYVKYLHVRSSVRILLQTESDKNVTMFISDFHNALHTVGMTGVLLYGRWKFVKRGQFYGVALVCLTTV